LIEDSKILALDLLESSTLKGYRYIEIKIQIENEMYLDEIITKLIGKQRKL